MRDVGVPVPDRPTSEKGQPAARRVHFAFVRAAGRTCLARQYVTYPFHITRPFYLDRQPAGLATLYLQSAAGGIYSGDHLELTIDAAPGAHCQVTTQGSTIVHDGRGRTSRLATTIHAGADAFVGWINEPTILFRGAAIEMRTDVRLDRGATSVLAEALILHDPSGGDREGFALLASQLTVTAASGRVLAVDRLRITGADVSRLAPHGPFATAGTLYALGRLPASVSLEDLEDGIAASGSSVAATRLPNDAGLMVRLLASDGARLTRALRLAWELLFTGSFGAPPGARPK
jgi:urease accessory protein